MLATNKEQHANINELQVQSKSLKHYGLFQRIAPTQIHVLHYIALACHFHMIIHHHSDAIFCSILVFPQLALYSPCFKHNECSSA